MAVFAGVPTMYWGINSFLENQDFDISGIKTNLRMCISGGASLPVAVLEKFEALFELISLRASVCLKVHLW